MATRNILVGICLFAAVLIFDSEAKAEDFVLEYDPQSRDPSLVDRAYRAKPNPDFCLCLAQDGDHLWVGTTAGAVRWNPNDHTARLFKADADWDMEFANAHASYDEAKRTAYLDKWLRNVVVRIVVLSPGHVWIEARNGATLVHDDDQEVFDSKEEGWARLYHGDLRPSLKKVVAMDRAGHLWWIPTYGGSIDPFRKREIRHYDGSTWETLEGHAGGAQGAPELECIISDPRGHLWGCGPGGIFGRQDDRWERVLPGRYSEMRLTSSGTLWAFAMGRLARFSGQRWEEFMGKGRFEYFWLPATIYGQESDVQETPDGRLYFRSSEHGLMYLDEQSFRNVPKIDEITVIAPAADGTLFVSAYPALWQGLGKEWKRIDLPPRPKEGPGAVAVIKDMLVTSDGTLWAATRKGLLRHKAGKWESLLFETGLQMLKETHRLAEGKPAKPVQQEIETAYRAYVQEAGKHLIDAADDELAEDIAKGTEPTSMLISYYRLVRRDKKRAEECMGKRVTRICKKAVAEGTEPWLTVMELFFYAPVSVESLMRLVKKGNAEEREMAIASLEYLQDAEVADQLLGMSKKYRREAHTYVGIAVVAVAAGDPRGIDLLIEGATSDEEKKFELVESSRAMLQKFTKEYDDLPDDWSRDAWNAWWNKHRDGWKPPAVFGEEPIGPNLRRMHEIYEAVAIRLETREEEIKEREAEEEMPTPSRPDIEGRGVNLQKLRLIKLPENATDDQVRHYIHEIIAATRGQNTFSQDGPQVRMLTKVGSKRVGFLLEALLENPQREGEYYVIPAIIRLATEEHKKLILDALPDYNDFVKVVLDKGWEQDAKAILVEEVAARPRFLPTEWIEAVAHLKDPETYDDLKAYFINGPNRGWTYKSIRHLPGFDLREAVAQAWEKTKSGKGWEAKDVAVIAVQHGHLDALEYLVRWLAEYPDDEPKVYGARSTILHHIPFRGSNEAIAEWFEKNKNQLVWDPKTKKFRLEEENHEK